MYAYKIMYVLYLIYEWTILILHGCSFKYINDIALYMKYDERKGTSQILIIAISVYVISILGWRKFFCIWDRQDKHQQL